MQDDAIRMGPCLPPAQHNPHTVILREAQMRRMSLKVGDRAPEFELIDTELKPVTLKELNRDGKVVISFIVAASSPVCEKELCSFRDSWDAIKSAGAKVVAVSNDGPFANKAFAQANSLNFPVLSDYASKAIRDYGVLMPDLLHIKGYNAAKRSVFVVMEDGTVGYAWVSEDPLKEPDYDAIYKFVSG